MSGKVGGSAAKALLYGGVCGLALLCGSAASAWSWPARLDDPLYARPPVLDRGAVLPGDGQPIVCTSGAVANHPLTLSETVDLALCNNPQIKAAWAAIKTQSGAVGEARAAYLPTVTSTLSQLHTRNEFPGHPDANNSTDGHTLYAGLNWRIFDFGTRAANREAANALLVAAMTAHDAALQKTLASVVGAYFDVLTAHAAVAARAEATKLAQDTLDATERRERKGAAGQSDTLQARTALAKAQLAEQRACADDNKAVAALVYAIGLKPGVPIELVEMREGTSTEGIGNLQGWLDEAVAKHPAIAAARAQWDAARAKVRQVRDEGLPSIDLTGNVYQNGYPNQGLQGARTTVTTVGVTLTIPLFEGFARTYKVQGAAAQVEQSAAQYEDIEHQTLSDVIKTHADAVSALGNLEASDTLLNSARAALVSSERRYARGAADILELLSTQSALSDALQERVRCISEWRSARVRLLATAGMLGRSQLDRLNQ